jgi:hypothetical protein
LSGSGEFQPAVGPVEEDAIEVQHIATEQDEIFAPAARHFDADGTDALDRHLQLKDRQPEAVPVKFEGTTVRSEPVSTLAESPEKNLPDFTVEIIRRTCGNGIASSTA